MPVFDFQHEESGEIISVYVKLSAEIDDFRVQNKEGKTYKRVWEPIRVNKDTKMGDGTLEDYRRLTNEKNLTVGQMSEISEELHIKRAEKRGQDDVREQLYKDYRKANGRDHPDVEKRKKQQMRDELFKKTGVRVS